MHKCLLCYGLLTLQSSNNFKWEYPVTWLSKVYIIQSYLLVFEIWKKNQKNLALPGVNN